MWNSESKIWQSVRSGIKNLQSVRIRIRTSHRVNFQIHFLSSWKILKPKILNMTDFEIKTFTTCQLLNQNVFVPDFESQIQQRVRIWIKQLQKICHILIGKFYNACDFWTQKPYNVSDSDAKIHNASHFESNASQFFLFYIRKCPKFLTLEGKFYKNFTFQSNFLQRVRSWNQKF